MRQHDDRINSRIKENDAAHCINRKVGLGSKKKTGKEKATGKENLFFKGFYAPNIYLGFK